MVATDALGFRIYLMRQEPYLDQLLPGGIKFQTGVDYFDRGYYFEKPRLFTSYSEADFSVLYELPHSVKK
jgi:hypothetical protein